MERGYVVNCQPTWVHLFAPVWFDAFRRALHETELSRALAVNLVASTRN